MKGSTEIFWRHMRGKHMACAKRLPARSTKEAVALRNAITDYNLRIGLSALTSANLVAVVLAFWWSWQSFELVPWKTTRTTEVKAFK